MPNLTFPKTALEPRPNLPVGQIMVIFTGFKPKMSKNVEKPSVNMNPTLSITGDGRQGPDGKPLNGQRVFENLNLGFLPRVQDFLHAFGVEFVENGDNVDIPGYFDGDTDNPDPTKWGAYHGPLENESATLELAEEKSRRQGAKPTDTQVSIKRYICRVPGCQVSHMESLLQG